MEDMDLIWLYSAEVMLQLRLRCAGGWSRVQQSSLQKHMLACMFWLHESAHALAVAASHLVAW